VFYVIASISIYTIQEVDKFFEEVNGLELEPEILPDINSCFSNSGWSRPLSGAYDIVFYQLCFSICQQFFYPFNLFQFTLHSNMQFFL
jgi:hypothetical protein